MDAANVSGHNRTVGAVDAQSHQFWRVVSSIDSLRTVVLRRSVNRGLCSTRPTSRAVVRATPITSAIGRHSACGNRAEGKTSSIAVSNESPERVNRPDGASRRSIASSDSLIASPRSHRSSRSTVASTPG